MAESEAESKEDKGGAQESSAGSDDVEWVKLDMKARTFCKLLDWSYMDFSTTVRTTTTLRTIKEAITKHHGGKLSRLTVCKGDYRETNELRDESLTLKEYGIEGALDKDVPTVTLHYNFVPDGCDEPDPVLMC